MTVLEQRFMDAAIAYFTRNRKEKKFIEVTTVSGEKALINKSSIIIVMPYSEDIGNTLIITPVGFDNVTVTESYDEIKAMLYE